MINYNDLIGLQYQYGAKPSDGNGKTDCWQLCVELRTRLGMKTNLDNFEWVYSQWPEDAANLRLLVSLLKQHAQKIFEPRAGSIFNMPQSRGKIILATIVDNGNCLFIGPGKMVVAVPLGTINPKHFFWAE